MDRPRARCRAPSEARLRRALKLLGFDALSLPRLSIRPLEMNDTVNKPRKACHPQAGQRMSGAEMIIQVLADEGVSAIFGYSGGAILPTYDAVFLYNQRRGGSQARSRCPSTCLRTSKGAGFMAAGYARATGRVGVCLVTSGPGATNTVTPVRDCMADSVPIVVICGQVPTGAIGTDAFQRHRCPRSWVPSPSTSF